MIYQLLISSLILLWSEIDIVWFLLFLIFKFCSWSTMCSTLMYVAVNLTGCFGWMKESIGVDYIQLIVLLNSTMSFLILCLLAMSISCSKVLKSWTMIVDLSTGIPHFITLHRYVFFTNWMFVQPCIEQVYQHHFSNSICSLHVSVSHNSHNISNFLLLYLLCESEISDPSCYCCNCLKAPQTTPIKDCEFNQ